MRQLQELEMQDAALRASLKVFEKYRGRYLGIYEFAAIGYFTLTRDDVISEINLAGATMLGEERNKLVNHFGFDPPLPVASDFVGWIHAFGTIPCSLLRGALLPQ